MPKKSKPKRVTVSEHLVAIHRQLEYLTSQVHELSSFVVPMYTKGVTIRDHIKAIDRQMKYLSEDSNDEVHPAE